MDFIFNILPLLKDGLVQHVSPSLTTKGGVFVYWCLNWCDMVALETVENKIQ